MDSQPTDQYPANNLPKLASKTIQAIKLIEAGIPDREALALVNGKDVISSAGLSKFRQKVRKYSLVAPQTVKLAHRTVLDILHGTPRIEEHRKATNDGVIEYQDNVYPTYTHQLGAAQMVYDRYEPIRQQAEADPGKGAVYLDLSSISYEVTQNVQINRGNGDEKP